MFVNTSLEISKKLGDQLGIATTLYHLGTIAEQDGNQTEAVRLFREALSISEKLGSPYAEDSRQALARIESAPSSHTSKGGMGFAPPRNQIEESLTKIWADILGVERVGIFDNFFDLGGGSLLVIQVASRAREALQVEIGILSFFEHPTVAEMAVEISKELERKLGSSSSNLQENLESLTENDLHDLFPQGINIPKKL